MKRNLIGYALGSSLLAVSLGFGLAADRPAETMDFPASTQTQVDAHPVEPGEGGSSVQVFETEHIWDATVTIAEGIILGESKHGWRRVVPITGGTFEGPRIRGVVVPGGEDWQLTRPDGDTELHARYLLRTHDGHLVQVINRVLIHYPTGGDETGTYIRSVVDLEAEVGGPYEYLNHAIYIGTLTEPIKEEGADPYVVVGVYKVL